MPVYRLTVQKNCLKKISTALHSDGFKTHRYVNAMMIFRKLMIYHK